MVKLEKLTTEQLKIMEETRDEWLDFIFSCKNTEINREEATKGINWLYESSGLESPTIIFLDSPLGLQYCANLIKYNVGANVRANVRVNVLDNVGDNVIANVRDNVRVNVLDNVGDNVRVNVGVNVGVNVRDNVLDNVRANVREFYDFSWYGNIGDYGWVAFYDFFNKVDVFTHEGFDKFKALLRSGIYDMIQFDKICLVCGLPTKINRDNGRLHSEKEPAIEFKDGFRRWYWKGIDVPQKLIETPELIDKGDLEQNGNAEKRRCFIEKLGVSKYFEILSNGKGLTIIDEDTDIQGYPMKLMSFDFEGKVIQVLEVTCPSTERVYNLYPPNQKSINVWDAKASTFNAEKLNYRHGDVGLKNINKQADKILIET